VCSRYRLRVVSNIVVDRLGRYGQVEICSLVMVLVGFSVVWVVGVFVALRLATI